MKKKNKPDCFMTPPEYIYTNEFHKAIYVARGSLEIYTKQNGFLWYLMISMMCVFNSRVTSVEHIKSYCQSLYGACEHEHPNKNENLFRCYVYLEGLEYLPFNLLDDSYFSVLSNKYHRHGNFISFARHYSLISSRVSVTGQ